MRFIVVLLFFSFAIQFASAQQPQIFLPLQKTAGHKFVVPVQQNFSLLPVIDSTKSVSPQSTLPLDFYSTHLGVACKMELKLEKQIKMPLRIRLGSKDQVDYLEGKYNRH